MLGNIITLGGLIHVPHAGESEQPFSSKSKPRRRQAALLAMALGTFGTFLLPAAPEGNPPQVAILSPANGDSISSPTLAVEVAFDARQGNLHLLILRANGTEVGHHENPPKIKSGTITFTLDTSLFPAGAVQLQAEGCKGALPANLVVQSEPVTIHITRGPPPDDVPPEIHAIVTPPPNEAGWHREDVTVRFSATDTGSGVASVSPDVVVHDETDGLLVTGVAFDHAGNSSSVSLTVRLDKTPPAIALAPDDGRTSNMFPPVFLVSHPDVVSGANLSSLSIFIDGENRTDEFLRLPQGASWHLPAAPTDGFHQWSVTISDLAGNVAQAEASFEVRADPVQTVLRGTVHGMDQQPLAGIVVSLADASTATDVNGEFLLPGEPGRRLLALDGTAAGFAYLAELIDIGPGLNHYLRPIYLPAVPLEEEGTPVSATEPTILTLPQFPGAALHVEPGAVFNPDGSPYDGKLLFLSVPTELTPLALPPEFDPNLVLAVQPGGQVFDPPALLTVPNHLGLPQGSIMELWSLNPVTGVFEVKGRGQVQGDLVVTVEGGMQVSAWHFFVPPKAHVFTAKAPDNRDRDLNCSKVPGQSVVNINTGDLEETHALPPVRFLGQTFSPRLVYHSTAASPRAIIEADVDYRGTLTPRFAEESISIAGITVPGPVRDTSTLQDGIMRVAAQVDLSHVPSGLAGLNYVLRGVYENDDPTLPPGTRLGNAAVASSANVPLMINNQIASPFGAGWTLDLPIPGGYQRLLPAGGPVMGLEGNGSTKLYQPAQQPMMQCLGDQLWVMGRGFVSVYDGNSLTLLKQFDFGAAGGRWAINMAMDPVRQRAYIMTGRDVEAQLWEVNPVDFTARGGPLLPQFDPDRTRHKMIVTAYGQIVISGVHLELREAGLQILSQDSLFPLGFIQTPALGLDGYASRLIASRDGQAAWILDSRTPQIRALDLATLAVTNTIFLPVFGDDFATGLATSDLRRELYYLGRVGDTAVLVILDRDTGLVKHQIAFPGFKPWSAETSVAAGVNGLVFVNVLETSSLLPVLKSVDAQSGAVVNPFLASDVFTMESSEEDSRLFLDVHIFAPTLIQIVQGETGAILNQITRDVSVNQLRFLPGGALPPDALPYTLPAGNFGQLSRRHNGTPENPEDDFYERIYKDGSVQRFDSAGLLVTAADRHGNTFQFEYHDADEDGASEELARIVTPVATLFDFTYAGGKLASITDPAGRITRFQHDENGNLVRITNPDDTERRFAYDENHLLVGQTDARGYETRYEYDEFQCVIRATMPDGAARDYRAAAGAGLVSAASRLGTHERPAPATESAAVRGSFTNGRGFTSSTRTTHPLGGINEFTDALGRSTQVERDPHSLPVRTTNPRGHVTRFSYDDRGNVLSVTRDATGDTRTIDYEPSFNLPTRITDSLGHATEFAYDERGNLIHLTNALDQVTSFAFTPRGQLASVTDARNRASSMSYDDQGRLLTVIDPLQRISSYTYDAAGNLLSATDPAGHTTTYTYDAMGRRLTRTDALGGVMRFSYDARGNLLSVRDANGRVTTFAYDPMNRRTTTTDALGRQSEIVYDESGNPAGLVDHGGSLWLTVYDALNRPVERIDPLQRTTAWTYDESGNRTRLTRADGAAIHYEFDLLNRLTAITEPDGSVTSFGYDALDRLIRVTDALGQATIYSYDALRRQVAETDPLGRRAQWQYDATGNLTRFIRADGTATAHAYDGLGRLTETVAADGGVTRFGYDLAGNLTALTDANGNTRTFSHDALHRMATETDPLGRTRRWTYDAVGNVLSLERRDGAVITYAYDALHRLIRKQLPALPGAPPDIVTLNYDILGNLTAAADNDSLWQTTFDLLSRPVETVQTVAGLPPVTLQYEYDVMDRRAAMLDPTGATKYDYDARDRLVALTDPAERTFVFTYDALSRPTSIASPNGVVTEYDYDAAGQLLRLDHSRQGLSLSAVTYEYNATGNRIAESHEDGFTRTLTYDPVDRLLAATHDVLTGGNESFAYDPVGNWQTGSRQHDADNQLLADDRRLYSHDTEGNLIQKLGRAFPNTGAMLIYDAENRLVHHLSESMAAPGSMSTFQYDAFGRRVARTVDGVTTRYVPDGGNVLLEMDAAGRIVAANTHRGLDRILVRDQGEETLFVHGDALDSTMAVTDPFGQVVERYRYSAFGRVQVLLPDGTPLPGVAPRLDYTFTGREWDAATGLYHYRARYYDPALGRFISQDPIGVDGGVNFYAYVDNNPFNLTDPQGLSPSLGALFWINVYENGASDAGRFFRQLGANVKSIHDGLRYALLNPYDALVDSYDSLQRVGCQAGHFSVNFHNNALHALDRLGSRLATPEGIADATIFLETLLAPALKGAGTGARGSGLWDDLLPVGNDVVRVADDAAEVATRADNFVIGRTKDLETEGVVKEGERLVPVDVVRRTDSTIVERPTYQSNSTELRKAMREGKPIRDVSPRNYQGRFLNLEREIMTRRGWTEQVVDGETWWVPPKS